MLFLESVVALATESSGRWDLPFALSVAAVSCRVEGAGALGFRTG